MLIVTTGKPLSFTKRDVTILFSRTKGGGSSLTNPFASGREVGHLFLPVVSHLLLSLTQGLFQTAVGKCCHRCTIPLFERLLGFWQGAAQQPPYCCVWASSTSLSFASTSIDPVRLSLALLSTHIFQ